MTDEKKNILVAWDFSEVAAHALEHAFIFADKAVVEITLLHIVKYESEKDDAMKLLQKSVKQIEDEKGKKVNCLVEIGNIFKTINLVAERNKSMLVIMGTHGIRGMQKLTGSWALKVVVGSKIPYIVVHDSPIKDSYKSIVFPINFKFETTEKLRWAIFLNKFFEAKIYLITPKINDETYTGRIKANLMFSKRYLAERKIDFEIQTTTETTDYGEEILKYAKGVGADIIIIMTTKNIGIQDYFLGANEQYIIDNSFSIPVMCVNPRTDLTKLTMFY